MPRIARLPDGRSIRQFSTGMLMASEGSPAKLIAERLGVPRNSAEEMHSAARYVFETTHRVPLGSLYSQEREPLGDGQLLRSMRTETGLDQITVAQAMGISAGLLQKMECGRKPFLRHHTKRFVHTICILYNRLNPSLIQGAHNSP